MNDSIEIDGLTFRVSLQPDPDAGAPWDSQDTYGSVSNWTSRSKAPGERVLNTDRSARRLYDFAGAVAEARRQGLSGPDAAEAAEREFQYLRGWCNDQWGYVGVIVTLLDTEGEPTNVEDALWGVDDNGDYAQTVAYDLALGLHTQVGHLDALTTTQRIREAGQ